MHWAVSRILVKLEGRVPWRGVLKYVHIHITFRRWLLSNIELERFLYIYLFNLL